MAPSTTIHSYSPYGEPNAWAGPRFRYTGQVALPEAALYHYKARVYDPVLGQFLQTDPVGYEDDPNLYAYVQNDPVNDSDSTGACPQCLTTVIGGVVGGVANGAIYAYESNESGDFTWGGFWANTGEGALTGAVIGSGAGLVAVLAVGAGSNVVEGAITDTAAGRSLGGNAGEVALNVAGDAVAGAAEAAFGRNVGGPTRRLLGEVAGDLRSAVQRPGMGYISDRVLPLPAAATAAGGATAEAVAGEVTQRTVQALPQREREPGRSPKR